MSPKNVIWANIDINSKQRKVNFLYHILVCFLKESVKGSRQIFKINRSFIRGERERGRDKFTQNMRGLAICAASYIEENQTNEIFVGKLGIKGEK